MTSFTGKIWYGNDNFFSGGPLILRKNTWQFCCRPFPVIFVLREKVGNRTAKYFSVKFTVHRKKIVVYYILPVNEVILRYFYSIPCKTKRFLRWTVKITLDIA